MNIESFNSNIQKLYAQVQTDRDGNTRHAIVHAKAFLKEAKKTEDHALIGIAYYFLGDACFNYSNNNKDFLNALQQAVLYLQNTEETDYLKNVYNLLGIDANNHGNIQLAMDYFAKALHLTDNTEPSEVTTRIMYNIGQLFYQIEEYKIALRYFKKAHQMIHKLHSKDHALIEGYCYCSEGIINLLLHRKTSASRCLDGVNKIIRDSSNANNFSEDPFLILFRIRMSHENEDIKERDRLIQLFLQQLLQDDMDIRYIDEIMSFIQFITEIGKYEEALQAVEHMEPILLEANLPSILASFAKLRISLYSYLDREDAYVRALSDYFRYSEQHSLSANKAYAIALETQLSVDAIKKENKRLSEAVNTDFLTGIPNRGALNSYLDELFEDCYHLEESLGVEFLDVDFFKEYNDTYGHQAGDQVLTKVAGILKDIAKDPRIYVARYGGDEFVIAYRNMTDDEIMSRAEEIRSRVIALNITHKYSKTSNIVTVSQGIRNRVPRNGNKLWDFLYTADNALYQVKKSQKGQIMLMHTAIISSKSLADATQI